MKSFRNFILGLTVFISAFSFMNQEKEALAVKPDIVIPMGQIIPFSVPEGLITAAIGNEKIAKAVIPAGQDRLALITALKPGFTNLLVWTEASETPNNFILEVQDTQRTEQIATKVKVLEILEGNDGRVGVDWQDFITFQEAAPSAPFKFGLPTRLNVLEARIDTLVNDRKAKLLAEPTLVSLSGKEAKFLSGGEYPLLIYERDRVNITWKEYGIKLEIKASVEGTDTIIATIKPEVSTIDKANSVTVTGVSSAGSVIIPAFNSRKAETTLSLKDGQTIVIAGLINETDEKVEGKFPLLGDIPFLGNLFKTTEFKKVKSELVFLVTPKILESNEKIPESNYAKEADRK